MPMNQLLNSSSLSDAPLTAATTETPATPTHVVQQQAPRVARPVIAGPTPAAAPAAGANDRDGVRRTIGARSVMPVAPPNPTPIETRTIATVGKNGSSRVPHGCTTRSPG